MLAACTPPSGSPLSAAVRLAAFPVGLAPTKPREQMSESAGLLQKCLLTHFSTDTLETHLVDGGLL